MSGGRLAVAVAPLRREPSHEAECVTQALHGEAFETLERAPDESWLRVRLVGDGYEGWLRSWYAAEGSTSAGTGLRVRARSAEVREKAAASAPILTVLPWQARLDEEERAGAWSRVRLVDGRSGFVATRQVAPGSAPGGPPTATRLSKTAERLMGSPYLWGGRSVWGFDCSGLLQAVFAWHGVAIPRDSRDQLSVARAAGLRQIRRGTGIDPSRPPIGELLFFGPDPETATHVGLSRGHGEFLHAYGQVCLGSLNASSQVFVPTLVSAFLEAISWRAFMPSEPGRSE